MIILKLNNLNVFNFYKEGACNENGSNWLWEHCIKEHLPVMVLLGVKIHALCDISSDNINQAKEILNHEIPIYSYYIYFFLQLVRPFINWEQN